MVEEVDLALNPPSIRPLVNLKRVQFKLVRGVAGTHYHWTVYLPTQIQKTMSKAEAKENMAIIIDRIMSGRFDVLEIDLTEGWERTMVGGYKHLRQMVSSKFSSKKKKRKIRAKRKVKVIVRRKNLYANLSKACLGYRRLKKVVSKKPKRGSNKNRKG